MSIKLKLTLVTLFLGCSLVLPVHAQWAKVGKTVSKQAVKALKSAFLLHNLAHQSAHHIKALKSGKTTTVIRKSTQRTTTGSTSRYARYGNAGRSAAMASQHVKVICTTCSGRGYYIYNGYRYQCSSCSGFRIVRR